MTLATPNPLLKIEDLAVSFAVDEGRLTAVNHISFSIYEGEVVGLVGESGCGKSATALSILRLIPSPPGQIESGRIWFSNRDILSLDIHALRAIRGRMISMIFQEPMTALSPLHRVGAQLVETLRLHGIGDKDTQWKIAAEWLEKVGIPDASQRLHAYPYELSGGMRQRVMIAMALMLDPRLIIADEPTTALDVTIQAQIFALMKTIRATSTAILLITHDMGVIWEMCHRVLVMYASEIVEEGPVDVLFNQPLHPYTQLLMQSIPALAGNRKRLQSIPGQVPSPLNYPRGCHFSDRCPRVMARCRLEKPRLYQWSENRRVACFLHQEHAEKIGH